MKTIYLTRIQMYETCTRGLLVDADSGEVFYTLERPWLDNASNISCIPKGTYTCKWHLSPTFGWVYLVTDVPDRSFILFHSGNVVRHTKGCILIGSRFGRLGNDPAVLSSKPATRKFFDLLDKQDFTLKVL
jgi:hypothetical protein